MNTTRRNFFTTALGTLGGLLLSRKAAADESLYTKGSLDTGLILRLFNIEAEPPSPGGVTYGLLGKRS
jgi:hypothetical protein